MLDIKQNCSGFESFKQLFPKRAVFLIDVKGSKSHLFRPSNAMIRSNSSNGSFSRASSNQTSHDDESANTGASTPRSSAAMYNQEDGAKAALDSIHSILNHQPSAFIVVAIGGGGYNKLKEIYGSFFPSEILISPQKFYPLYAV